MRDRLRGKRAVVALEMVWTLRLLSCVRSTFGAKRLDADGNVMPAGKTHFCTMLDGEGQEVFDVIRSSFALARERSGHVVMTATITANQKKWKPAPEPQLSRAESPPAVDGLPFYDSIDDVLGELDMW